MKNTIERLTTALADRYAIQEELGAGGMATVYLAEDLKHHRKVAVKVLRPELAAILGAERFLKEIEVTANLQHPNILPLFDSGEAGGEDGRGMPRPFIYYVMPYVEGESLRDKLNRDKQLGVEETVEIAKGVLAALDYAHRQGVIHRDIKPENILIHDGQPVVADFGIALAVTTAGGTRLTETGLSLGTPQYMSPEQATGEREVTAKSDVYSLGAVVYEMLVGDPPHTGSTVQAIVAKVVSAEPQPISDVRHTVPANVQAAVQKALAKVPADRFARASDMARALQDPAFRHGEDTTSVGGAGSNRWKTLAVGASALSVAALIVAGLSLVAPRNPATPVTRWEIVPYGEGVPRPVGATYAIAPDGSSIVFADARADGGGWQLWLKPRAEAEAVPLPGTDSALNVTYSPDGRDIAFASGTDIKRRPIGDGPTFTVAQGAPAGQIGLAWLDDKTMIYEGAGGVILRIPETGGAADTVPGLPTDYFALDYLGALPVSYAALVGLCLHGCYVSKQLTVMDFRADTSRLLIDEAMRGWYVPSGHLVYVRRDGVVFAAPFDLEALELAGPEVLLFEGVAVTGSTPEMVVGKDGTVIYATGPAPGAVGNRAEVVWVDRSGEAEVVDSAWTAAFTDLALSPTGDRLAVVQRHPDGSRHIWIKQFDLGPPQQVTFEGRHNFDPAWMPDGRSIVFASDRAGGINIFEKRADGKQNAVLLLDEEENVSEPVISADGEWLIYSRPTGNGRDIMAKPLGKNGDPVGIADLEGVNELFPALSPDGRWLAYRSDEARRRRFDIWVRAFPTGAPKWQVSYNVFGTRPHWGHDGRELFHRSGSSNWEMVSVEVFPDSTFVRGPATVLFPWGGLDREIWDVAPDDRRFIFFRDVTPRHTIVVENFLELLKAKVGN